MHLVLNLSGHRQVGGCASKPADRSDLYPRKSHAIAKLEVIKTGFIRFLGIINTPINLFLIPWCYDVGSQGFFG